MDCNSSNSERTVSQYIRGISSMSPGEEVLSNILFDRGISPDIPVVELSKKEKELLKADVYTALSNMPSVKVSVEDSDGNWKHKEGGGQVSDADKKRWASIANSIYAQYGEIRYASSGPRIHARGMRIWRNGYGC